MKNILLFFFVTLPISLPAASSYFSIRSQSEDSARELVGWVNEINLFDVEQFYAVFAITPEYTRSISPDNIVDCLFGTISCDKECPMITISGSRTENRGNYDWLADYFGLPTDFKSVISLDPHVTNFLVDFNLYLGLDNIYEGLFFKIHAPIVHTKWNLNFSEDIINIGTNDYVEGYFTPDIVPRDNLLNSFQEYIMQGASPQLPNNVEFSPLSCCLFTCCPQTATKLSDIQIAFGWNFIQNIDYHLGLSARCAIPTGTRPTCQFIFEPVIGNGHHWEAGFGVTSHVILWRGEFETEHFGLYVDANITHLITTKQCRCFDIKTSENSRYMLAQRLTPPVENLFANPEDMMAGGTAPVAQFKNLYVPVSNLTHMPVNVSAAIQVDLTAMFNLTYGPFSWDLGYNIWARTCEKIHFNCHCITPLDDGKTWALKGDAATFGFAARDFGSVVENQPIALSGSQSKATITKGTNNFVGPDGNQGGIDGIRPTRNPGVDNSQFALFSDSLVLDEFFILDRPTTDNGLQTKTSNNTVNECGQTVIPGPIFLNRNNIDFKANRTKGLAHKIFTHFNFSWQASDHLSAYFGAGVKIEFTDPERLCRNILSESVCDAAFCPSICDRSCDNCQRCSLSEWGVWIKTGISYQ